MITFFAFAHMLMLHHTDVAYMSIHGRCYGMGGVGRDEGCSYID